MWHIKRIQATNICAFESLCYEPWQGGATLIFGDNQDSESQNSNGSGKSALIEAVAIGLTGEPLRKVNADEIINDRFDEAAVTLVLANPELECSLAVSRKLSRKQPQSIHITRQNGPCSAEEKEIVLPSVADYNKYVLEQIGLAKDDILSSFILTARKYKSFLSSSDKEKKDIINRFSNGAMVDEAIAAVKADLDSVLESLSQARRQASYIEGAISAVSAEIEKALFEAEERRETKLARIEKWKALIAEKRAAKRKAQEEIDALSKEADELERYAEELENIEHGDIELTDAYKRISQAFDSYKLQGFADYAKELEDKQSQLERCNAECAKIASELEKLQKECDAKQAGLSQLVKDVSKQESGLDEKSAQIEARINELVKQCGDTRAMIRDLSQEHNKTDQAIAKLERELAGVIECPKCHHEFTLSMSVDVAEARKNLQSLKDKAVKLEGEIAEREAENEQNMTEGRQQRSRQADLETQRQKIKKEYNEACNSAAAMQKGLAILSTRHEKAKQASIALQCATFNLKTRMFDDAFNILQNRVNACDSRGEALEQTICGLDGAILTYQEQIKESENASEEEIAEKLGASKKEYEKSLEQAKAELSRIEAEAAKLEAQSNRFTDFKTHLANTKINAIAAMTNEFLDAIGSDLKVSLSGYTMLKSGKVRDKISVSVSRDGYDCGSFEKLSAGERVRVELASILAMRHLTNSNAPEGKGLDLLVCDEILDSSDESGLANIFKALNSTGVTSLVVSHAAVAENYPSRIVVRKKNGVSRIDDGTGDA